MFIKIVLFLSLIASCSNLEGPPRPHVTKEFSKEELISATQLLSKIFDQEMAPLSCVPDPDEASLLLRTIHPRMDVVQDDIEALLDSNEEVDKLIRTCDQGCTCEYLDDILREHLVTLNAEQLKLMSKKKTPKVLARCLNYSRETFCKSELYQELNKEKVDFSFEE